MRAPVAARKPTTDRLIRSRPTLGYTLPMEVQLSTAELERLAERAKSLGVSPEQLLRAAVTDYFSRLDQGFKDKVEEVLVENAELFRRLA